MIALISIISMLLSLAYWVLLAMIIMSWLISFNIINTRNQFVYTVWNALTALTEPVLKPVRRILPPIGGLDLSPIVVFLIILFLQIFVERDLPRYLGIY